MVRRGRRGRVRGTGPRGPRRGCRCGRGAARKSAGGTAGPPAGCTGTRVSGLRSSRRDTDYSEGDTSMTGQHRNEHWFISVRGANPPSGLWRVRAPRPRSGSRFYGPRKPAGTRCVERREGCWRGVPAAAGRCRPSRPAALTPSTLLPGERVPAETNPPPPRAPGLDG